MFDPLYVGIYELLKVQKFKYLLIDNLPNVN